jgi:hypothetical protein
MKEGREGESNKGRKKRRKERLKKGGNERRKCNKTGEAGTKQRQACNVQ